MTVICCKRTATVAARVRQRARAVAQWLAGATCRGGAGQGLGQLRNSPAHLIEVVTAAKVDRAGGEPERGGAAVRPKHACTSRAPQRPSKRVPRHLGTTRRLP